MSVPCDPVDHPEHYELPGGIQVYDVIAATQSREELVGFCKGNVKKYMLRADRKGGVEDYRKGRWYLDKLIEMIEGQMTESSYGDVVATKEPRYVEMSAGKERGVTVRIGMPYDNHYPSHPELSIETDFDTARSMVEGNVSILFVVTKDGDADA